jgi:hypothetical protein
MKTIHATIQMIKIISIIIIFCDKRFIANLPEILLVIKSLIGNQEIDIGILYLAMMLTASIH